MGVLSVVPRAVCDRKIVAIVYESGLVGCVKISYDDQGYKVKNERMFTQ